jgi:basic membrane protein A
MRKSIAALGTALALALAAGAAEAQDKLKVCFVYVGPHNDGGYSEGHDKGRIYLQDHLGDKVETQYVENVAEGPDAERAIERLARSGCGLIFTTSFGFMDPTIKAAAKFPDVKFEHATGFKTAENVSTYNARFYEGRYILGQIAAKVSEAGLAGYIVSFPIPEVVMGINAFMLGAQSVNPDFKVKIVWVNSWFDPAKEADAAKALFDQGADIIVQHTDSPAPLQIAEERGLHGFGQAHDMIDFAPDAQLTAIVDNWGPYYVERTQDVLDGTWKSQESWEGLKEQILVMAPYTNMPDDVKAMAEATEAAIKSGELHPFKGPIVNQAGEQVIGEGEHLDDGTLLGMNWYVQGIDDQLPQ